MSEHLVHLIAFWSAYFISAQGVTIVRSGMRDRLIELLDALPPSFEGVLELRGHAASLSEDATVGMDHPINQAMLAFLLKYEKEIPDKFQNNIHNIKSFLSPGQR
jgi:hypothetical protein